MTNSTRKILYIVTDIWPQPEKFCEVKQMLYGTVAEAKKERTCLKYELCENINEKFQLTFLQAWSTEEAFENHLKSDFIVKALDELRSWLAKPSETRRYVNIG